MVGFHDSDLTTNYDLLLGVLEKSVDTSPPVLRANKEEWMAGQWQEQLCQPVSGR